MSAFERMAQIQHDTLDGIPEPSEHCGLVGHGDIAARLAAAYRSGRMHHGLLLAGPAGIGKATLAFRLAWQLLTYPNAATAPSELRLPSPADPVFRKVAQGAHPAVLHLTRPANERTKGFKTVITVEEVRRVSRFLSMTSHDGGWRVVIVDPADDLNTNAANALLKNLEEPPSRTLFVLITHAPGQLLPTIRSRCQMLRLEPLSGPELEAALAGLGLGLPAEANQRDTFIARAGGSVRQAILLTEYGGLEISGAVDELVSAPRFDVVAAQRIADAVAGKDGARQFELFNEHVLERLSRAAVEIGLGGATASAERLASCWREQRGVLTETETYNLDKRQYVGATLRRMHRALLGTQKPGL